jgi:hypothetical protein
METMLIREFRADHQRITGSLLRLKQAILQVDVPQVPRILGGADTLRGAHFKFEELHLYAAVSRVIGGSGVQQLLREHDDIFRGVGELLALTSKASWSDAGDTARAPQFLGVCRRASCRDGARAPACRGFLTPPPPERKPFSRSRR